MKSTGFGTSLGHWGRLATEVLREPWIMQNENSRIASARGDYPKNQRVRELMLGDYLGWNEDRCGTMATPRAWNVESER